MLQSGQNSPLALRISGLRGTGFAAWTLAAFTISVCAGALIRRMILGIATATTAWSGLLTAAVFWLHSDYQGPLTGVPAPVDADIGHPAQPNRSAGHRRQKPAWHR
jgi:hypothetical protein